MKLTQKTLFQCFEKPRASVSTINEKQNSQACESPVKTLPTQEKSHARLPGCLAPVHVRQLNDSSISDCTTLFNERKLSNDNFSLSTHEFYRMCPIVIDNEHNLPKVRITEISSSERQMELLCQYTENESTIDWKTMFNRFQECRKKALEQNQYEQLLWTEIYRPKDSKTYLGNHTRQVKRLNEWFSYWAKKLQSEQPKTKVTRKKRKRVINDDDDDDDDDRYSDEDFSNDSNKNFDHRCFIKSEHPQLIFIHGVGTTSLVHALAEEHNFKVTEINGSQTRARAPLLKQLEQVANHQLSFKRCPSDTVMPQDYKSNKEISSPLPAKKKAKNEQGSIASYFTQTKKSASQNDEHKENKTRRQSKSNGSRQVESKKLTNETNVTRRRSKTKPEEPPTMVSDVQLFSSVQVEKTSLILFDEIETLTTDDNFWSCLKKLLETAKKPIILTSNSRTNPEDAIINLSKIGYYELVHLETHESEHLLCFLRLILLIEMMEISSPDALSRLIAFCSNDLRRILLTLQFLAQSSPSQRKNQEFSPQNNNSTITKPIWQSSRVFDAMYYSHLVEQQNESPLKILFDELTKPYTSTYDQSHLLLIDHSKTDTKRIELYDTFKLFMQEQELDNIVDHPSFYLDYRPYIRQICQNEQNRMNESNSSRRFRHCLTFRGCSLQWSDFEILSTGIDLSLLHAMI